jgi:hypothetical protein
MSEIPSVCQFSKLQLNTELSYTFVTFRVPALKMEGAYSSEILVPTCQNQMVTICMYASAIISDLVQEFIPVATFSDSWLCVCVCLRVRV